MTAVNEWDVGVAVDDFLRDQWHHPLIMQPDGTRSPYTRSSTAAKTVEDTYNLERWQRGNVAYGMAYDASLVARLIALGGNPATWKKAEKNAVHAICDDAQKIAQAHKGADIGSALHHLTHRLDRGEDVEAGPYQADLDAYETTMAAHGLQLIPLYIECRIVNDLLKMAGSADRIVTLHGHYHVADIKTGATVDFGALGWAAQLAAYAGGQLYDITTEQRIPTPPIDQTTGYIIHLPAGQGKCDIYEVDLVAGHKAAELANQIRQIRKEAKQWLVPKSTWVAAPPHSAGVVEQQAPTVAAVGAIPSAADTDVPLSVAQPAPPPSRGGGAPNATPGDSESASRRRGLLDRYHALSELDRKRFDAHRGVDNPNNLDHIEHILEQIERTANRSSRDGWDDDDTNTDPQRPAPPPDEGDEVADVTIAVLRARYKTLPGEAQQWVAQLVAEGHAANVPWNTGGHHTQRRYQLGRAIVALAGWVWQHATLCPADANDIVRGLLEEATDAMFLDMPLGHAIGSLDADEATRFATLVDDYTSGDAT